MTALAWRNVWRRRGRSLAVAIVVGAVVWLSLVYFGLVGAAGSGMYRQIVAQSGHLQVRVAGWREQHELRNLLVPDVAQLAGRVQEALPGASVRPVLEVPALLSGEGRSRGVVLMGQAPPGWLEGRLHRGRWYGAGEGQTAVLGAALARALGVDVGDWVDAYVPGSQGVGAGAFQVVGIVGLPDAALELRTAFVPLAALQEIAAPGSATRLEVDVGIVTLRDDLQAEPLREVLAGALQATGRAGPELAVETWRTLNPAASRLVELIRPLAAAINGLFFVMAGLLVLNNVYLSLMERIREMGVILALGASRGRVLGLVVLESLMLSAAGGGAGLALGLATAAALARGFTYPYYDLEQWGLPQTLYVTLEPADVATTVAFTLLMATAAALWPGWVASRLQPAEAMRWRA